MVFSVIFLTALTLALSVTAPLNYTRLATGKMCCETPARFGASFSPIQFPSADGQTLSGWYIPPRNGAVIILVHSYYNDRRQTLPVAEMLYKHGFGLLMYDQRASGESTGTLRSLGALDIADLGAASRWLGTNKYILKIGAYGCSMGGAISLAGAVSEPSILAVAADAPSPLNWSENMPIFSLQDPVSLPTMALYYLFVQIRTQAYSPISTLDAARSFGMVQDGAAGSRPLLLISSGTGDEFVRVKRYFDAALEPKSHWNIPEASHCSGPAAQPDQYEQHLVDFFRSALQPTP